MANNIEMSERTNPVHDVTESERIKKILNQQPPPIFPSGKRMGGMRSGKAKRIVKYDPAGLRVYRALWGMTSRTILVNADTYYHLCYLTVVSMISFTIVINSNMEMNTIPIETSENFLNSRVLFLLSLILSSYVGFSLNRRATIRAKLGKLWGGLESMCHFTSMLLPPDSEFELRKHMNRLCRMTFILCFLGIQGTPVDEAMEELRKNDLVTDAEEKWLRECPEGTRPMMTVGWISQMTRLVYRKYRGGDLVTDMEGGFQLAMNIKGGVGALFGEIGTQAPFMYVHLVYWSVQLYLFFLAVNTGIYLAVMWARRLNGNSEYEYDDDDRGWPSNELSWYINIWAIRVAGNMAFALFVEGLLKLCQLIENPLKDDDQGFPQWAYTGFMFNNINSFDAGILSCAEVLASSGLTEDGSATTDKNKGIETSLPVGKGMKAFGLLSEKELLNASTAYLFPPHSKAQ